MADTSIQWTEKTWNPVTGCLKISPGCKHCYAETIADRFWAKQYPPNADGTPRKFTDVRCHEDRLDQPWHWKKPARVFVNSMSDLFHEDVPDWFLDRVFVTMAFNHRHTFQVLTKRPERMRDYCSSTAARDRILATLTDVAINVYGVKVTIQQKPDGMEGFNLPNVWLGVSVENQKYADERIPLLLQTPAAVRWVSAEPLLGPVDLTRFRPSRRNLSDYWVVCGGESGAGARPMNIDWARSLRDQCKRNGVPFFMKQLGGVRDSRGEMEQFPPDLQVREYPEGAR